MERTHVRCYAVNFQLSVGTNAAAKIILRWRIAECREALGASGRHGCGAGRGGGGAGLLNKEGRKQGTDFS
jgi:hypothetical protein